MTDHPNLTIGRAAMDAAAPGIPDLMLTRIPGHLITREAV